MAPVPDETFKTELERLSLDEEYRSDSQAHTGDGQGAGEAVCVKCTHLFIVNKSDQWYRYLCQASPRTIRYNAVLGFAGGEPPYYLCRDINPLGFCKLYREGVNDYQPKPFPT